ncbi:dTDP-4-dehydrorhamnose reductase [Dongia sp.]|uniref:dTDP-4-dehydrorhamnose reductase n=1 Tax=Dongia sp. TaxID=1977262 RepID=UPI0035B4DF90
MKSDGIQGRNVVVIGRHGQLARELADLDWPRHCLPHFLGRGEIDLFSPIAARSEIAALRPAVIINTAAFAGVDQAELEIDVAWRLNAALPAQLGAIAAALDVPLLHVSSDYVFAGDQTLPYDEDAGAAPLSTYGLSKHAGESAVLSSGARVLVIRSAWLFGRHGRNFLKTILNKAKADSTEPLRVVDDQLGSPTPASALAAMLRDAALDMASGRTMPPILHFAGSPASTWHYFAAAILDAYHATGYLSSRPALQAIATTAYASAARRPACSALDSRRAAALGYAPPDWRQAVTSLAAAWRAERRAA